MIAIGTMSASISNVGFPEFSGARAVVFWIAVVLQELHRERERAMFVALPPLTRWIMLGILHHGSPSSKPI